MHLGPAREALATAGHDVVWAGDWPESPSDDEVLARAAREGRVLITLDKDFGELAVVHGRPHHGIVRLVGFSARAQASACQAILKTYERDLRKGALITAHVDRVRIRVAD